MTFKKWIIIIINVILKHTETYRSGHNGADSKHSRVYHLPIFVNPLFIGVYATCNCTLRILHLAVFSQFGKSALPLQFYMETYRSGHNGADSKHSRVCHTPIFETPLFIGVYATCFCTFENSHLAVFSQFGIKALPLQFYMETYRSGHNGADSKSVREQSPASSNLAVSAKDNRNLRIAVVFFLWYNFR